MTKIYRTLLLLAFSLTCCPLWAYAQGSILYGVHASSLEISEVNPSTGSLSNTRTVSDSSGTFQGFNGFAIHPTSDTAYVIVRTGTGSSTTRSLATLDLATLDLSVIGDTGMRFAAITFNGDGTVLYGLTGNGADSPNSIFSIDLGTGTPTLVCDLSAEVPISGGGMLAWNTANSSLYRLNGNSGSTLQRINLSTCSITEAFTLPNNGDPNCMVYSESLGEFIVQYFNDPMRTLNPTTGALTAIPGAVGETALKGMAFTSVSDPDPELVTLPIDVVENSVTWGDLGFYGFRVDQATVGGQEAFRTYGEILINDFYYDDSPAAQADTPVTQDVVFEGGTRLGTKVTSATFPITDFQDAGDVLFDAVEEWFFYSSDIAGAAAGRHSIIFSNNNPVRVYSHLDYFASFTHAHNHTVVHTSEGDGIWSRADEYMITRPVDQPGSPFLVHVLQGPGGQEASPNFLNVRRENRLGQLIHDFNHHWDFSVGPNETKRISWFVLIADTLAEAIQAGDAFTSLASISSEGIFDDLSGVEQASLLNFNLSSSTPVVQECQISPENGYWYGCEYNSSCMFQMGLINGDASNNSIEFDTEYPIAGEDICYDPGSAQPSPSIHRDTVAVDLGSRRATSNTMMAVQPSVPGYLAASSPSLPSSFPETRSARSIEMTSRPDPGDTFSDPYIYVYRYGSERVRLTVDSSQTVAQSVLLDGVGERQHRIEALRLGTSLSGANSDEVTVQLEYVPGLGADNGFYIDAIGIREGPGELPITAPYGMVSAPFDRFPVRPPVGTGTAPLLGMQSAPTSLPSTIFQIGQKTFGPTNGSVIAQEFLKGTNSDSSFTYHVTFNGDNEIEAPEMPGIVGGSSRNSLRSARAIDIEFVLEAPVQSAWVSIKSFGFEAAPLLLDGSPIGEIKPTPTSAHTLYSVPVGSLSRGEHTLTISSSEIRYLDYVEMYDKAATQAQLGEAPQAPKIRKARFKGGTLRTNVRAKEGVNCDLRLYGGDAPTATSQLLASTTLANKKLRQRSRIGRKRQYFLRATLSCPGRQHVSSKVKKVRGRKRKKRKK